MNTQPKRRISPEEYLELEEASDIKHEYYDGELYAMSGGGPLHSAIAANIIAEVHHRLKNRRCRVYTSDLRLNVEATGLYTYPDVSIACADLRVIRHGHSETLLNPLVVVEVLSPSTAHYDRTAKFEHYRRVPSLREYVLVSQDAMQVELRSRLPDDTWSSRTLTGPDATLELESIRCTVPLADIYDKVFDFADDLTVPGEEDLEPDQAHTSRYTAAEDASHPRPPRIREELEPFDAPRRPPPPPPRHPPHPPPHA